LPVIQVVTPSMIKLVAFGSFVSSPSKWVCTSIKPGATIKPVASIVFHQYNLIPSLRQRSFHLRNVSVIQLLPLPSMIFPLRMIMSHPVATGFFAERKSEGKKNENQN
jgi:hypothetical protein